jgi:putative peptide zinc metalloprotease protein
MFRKQVCAAIAVVALVVGVADAASAGVSFNNAFAFSNPWYRQSFDLAYDLDHDRGPFVFAQNGAFAYATNCNGCRSIAIAVQIDLVAGDVQRIDARSRTQAITKGCTGCLALAAAHQFIVAPGGDRVWLSDSGRNQLSSIRAQLYALRWSRASGLEIQSQIEGLMQQVVNVLLSEVRTSDPVAATNARTTAAAAPAAPSIVVDHRGGTVFSDAVDGTVDG